MRIFIIGLGQDGYSVVVDSLFRLFLGFDYSRVCGVGLTGEIYLRPVVATAAVRSMTAVLLLLIHCLLFLPLFMGGYGLCLVLVL